MCVWCATSFPTATQLRGQRFLLCGCCVDLSSMTLVSRCNSYLNVFHTHTHTQSGTRPHPIKTHPRPYLSTIARPFPDHNLPWPPLHPPPPSTPFPPLIPTPLPPPTTQAPDFSVDAEAALERRMQEARLHNAAQLEQQEERRRMEDSLPRDLRDIL